MRQQLGLSRTVVPSNIKRYGNTSAASTLLLLHEDIEEGRLKAGDLLVFMWVGAGAGAMYGCAGLTI